MTKAGEILERVEPVSVDAELHDFLTDLKRYQAIPVEKDGSIEGLIFVNDVARRDYSINTKASSMVSRVNTVDSETDVAEVASAVLEGRKKAVPVMSGGAYAGIVPERNLLKPAGRMASGRKVSDVMSSPVTISSEDSVGKARSTMRDREIGCLPVTRDGELVGAVEWVSFLKLQRPSESMGRAYGGGNALQDFNMQVVNIMDASPVTVEAGDDLAAAAEAMSERGTAYAVVVSDKEVEGVVTGTDILEVIAADEPKEDGVYVQITGAEGLDSFEEEKLHSHVEESLQKLGKIYEGTEYFYLHIKRYETEGTRTKYSIRTRLATPVGTFHSKSHGYDFAGTVDEAMDRLERIVKDDHSKHIDRRRHKERHHKRP